LTVVRKRGLRDCRERSKSVGAELREALGGGSDVQKPRFGGFGIGGVVSTLSWRCTSVILLKLLLASSTEEDCS
jgi:cytochrome c biogenesis protein CcdA